MKIQNEDSLFLTNPFIISLWGNVSLIPETNNKFYHNEHEQNSSHDYYLSNSI